MSVEEKIFQNKERFSQKIAVISGNKSFTYSELWTKIVQWAGYFKYKRTLPQGSRVVVSASNEIEFVYAYFGLHLAGCICIPIDPQTNLIRLNRIIESAHPSFFIGHILNADFEVTPFSAFDEVSGNEDFRFPDKNAVADLLYTTGTTGIQKGVTLTYANEEAAVMNINSFIGNTEDDIELLALPVSHSFGLGRLRCVLYMGGTLDLLGSFANIKKFYAEILNRQITGFGMVPANWAYLKKLSEHKIAGFAYQIKYIEIGSASMPVEDKRLLMELLPNTKICMHYGLTEASRSSFMEFHSDKMHLDSIGKPSPNVEIKIFDKHGKELQDGSDGEICVKGLHVCNDYWGETRQDFSKNFYGEYFKTGDWGYKDKEGYVYLKSRLKEMINVGGKKVCPIEVEEVINSIAGIKESVCVGIADPNGVLGEVVKAYVVSENEIVFPLMIKVLMSKLENYKIPVAIERIDAIPRTSSGKIQRLVLKDNSII